MMQILQGMTIPVLKSLLSAMGRAVSGKKKELIARVRIPHPLSEPGAKRARINPSDEETTSTSTRSVDPPNIVKGACRSLRVLCSVNSNLCQMSHLCNNSNRLECPPIVQFDVIFLTPENHACLSSNRE